MFQGMTMYHMDRQCCQGGNPPGGNPVGFHFIDTGEDPTLYVWLETHQLVSI